MAVNGMMRPPQGPGMMLRDSNRECYFPSETSPDLPGFARGPQQ